MDWNDDATARGDSRSVPAIFVLRELNTHCSTFQASERLARRLQTEEELRRAQIANDAGIARALSVNDEALGNPWGRHNPPRQPPIARTSTATRQGVPATMTVVGRGEWPIYEYITSALSWLWGSPTNSQ